MVKNLTTSASNILFEEALLLRNSYPKITLSLTMDELDLQILRSLREDARIPYLKLASSLGVSDVTVHSRVRKMVEDGTITGFTTAIDYGKLGYTITAFLEINVKPGTADEVIDRLTKIEGVVEAHEIHGHCDILLKVKVRSLEELRDKIVNEIRKTKDLVRSEAYTVLKVVREGQCPTL